MTVNRDIRLRRLYWVGPATVATAVAAVMAFQKAIVPILPPGTRFTESILHSDDAS